jgi:hypothetical protein
MARRKKEIGIFEMLMELPWWVGVIFAALAYIFIGIVVPRMWAGNPVTQVLIGVCPTFAKLAAFVCLFAAATALSHIDRHDSFLSRIYLHLRDPRFRPGFHRFALLRDFYIVTSERGCFFMPTVARDSTYHELSGAMMRGGMNEQNRDDDAQGRVTRMAGWHPR